jgi:hypothetical protein
LREARAISRDQAGYSIRASESKISRMELGRVPFKERDVADLLTLYGVADDDERAPLLVNGPLRRAPAARFARHLAPACRRWWGRPASPAGRVGSHLA